jgi:hypothetical protein
MAKKPKDAPPGNINDQPPIGMVDGELKTYEPGEPIPGPVIVTEDGEELTPEQYRERFGGADEPEGDDEED